MLVIDGHNLIPKVRGLSLEAIDDEMDLIAQLQVYARVRRKQVRVFFDGAPPGQAGERAYGQVIAQFVPLGHTADEAIRQYVARLGRAARNITVVTSDRQVQANARALHAAVIPSEAFAEDLSAAQAASKTPGKGGTARAEPAAPLGEWLDIFGIDPQNADQPIEMKPEPKAKKPPKPGKGRRHHGFEQKG